MYIHFILIISEVLKRQEVTRLRISALKKIKQKLSGLSNHSVPNSWVTGCFYQSHPQPVSFAQLSDVNSQGVPQQVNIRKVILFKVSSPVLSLLVQGLSCSDGLIIISLSSRIAQNVISGD